MSESEEENGCCGAYRRAITYSSISEHAVVAAIEMDDAKV